MKVLFVLIALALIGYSQAQGMFALFIKGGATLLDDIVCSQCEFPEVWNHTESAGGCSALPAYIGNTVMIRHAENDYCFLTLGGCLTFEYLLTDGTCVESSPIRPHFCMGATSCSFQYTRDIGIEKVRCRQEAV